MLFWGVQKQVDSMTWKPPSPDSPTMVATLPTSSSTSPYSEGSLNLDLKHLVDPVAPRVDAHRGVPLAKLQEGARVLHPEEDLEGSHVTVLACGLIEISPSGDAT